MSNPDKSKFISIIIPTYNRPQQLATCLESLTSLDYPRDSFEVIVVDDGSKTELEPVVTPFSSKLDISLLRQTNNGAASARNTGAKQAKGAFLAFTDDDCMPAADWLKSLAARFDSAPDCLIGGRTINILSDNLFSTASQELIDYVYKYYNANPHKARFFASNNIALPTETFLAIGGFDVTYPRMASEDRELCDRWLQLGYPMLYAPEVQINHAHHLTLKSFWQQHFFYGRGAFCFHTIRAQRAAKPIEVEPLSFYINLFTYPMSSSKRPTGLLISALLFVSQLAATFGFFSERLAQKNITVAN